MIHYTELSKNPNKNADKFSIGHSLLVHNPFIINFDQDYSNSQITNL